MNSAQDLDDEPPPMIPYTNPFNPYDSDSESEPDFELGDTDSDTESVDEPTLTDHTLTTFTTPTTATPTMPHFALFHTHETTPLTLPDVDSFHGNEIQIPKPPNRTRFHTKNVHYVSTNNTDDELRIHFGDQHRLEIDFFGITKHKLDTHQYQVRQAFSDSARHIFQYRNGVDVPGFKGGAEVLERGTFVFRRQPIEISVPETEGSVGLHGEVVADGFIGWRVDWRWQVWRGPWRWSVVVVVSWKEGVPKKSLPCGV
jgi:hypothetical protein